MKDHRRRLKIRPSAAQIAAQSDPVKSAADTPLRILPAGEPETILDALKALKGSALRLINWGVLGGPRWLIWDAKSSDFVVYASNSPVDLGYEVHRGKSESEAVKALTVGTREQFRNTIEEPKYEDLPLDQ